MHYVHRYEAGKYRGSATSPESAKRTDLVLPPRTPGVDFIVSSRPREQLATDVNDSRFCNLSAMAKIASTETGGDADQRKGRRHGRESPEVG